MNALEPTFSNERKLVDDYLAAFFSHRSIPDALRDAMQYSLLAGGKRLRPVLCLACAKLLGCEEELVVPFAAAIEMIHTYSLIHDDLPCMDDDDMRRGRPSNHTVFGEAGALLAGDGLLTEAFFSMTQAKVPAARLCSAIQEIALAAGAAGMVGGQQVDLELTGQSGVTLESVRAMHAMKTGAMLRASCTCGALLAGASEADLAKIRVFGAELGIAFQIVDDILDEVADPSVLGKPVHSDREKEKSTYPSLVGLDESKRLALECVQRAAASIASFQGEMAQFLRALATFTVERVS